MTGRSDDWVAVVDRLLAGDRLALLEIDRLVTGVLVDLRAYDVRPEWDELRGEVVRSLLANARAGRLGEPRAVRGYIEILTRHKVVERLRTPPAGAEQPAAAEPSADANGAADGRDAGAGIWAAVGDLPAEHQRLLDGVYRQGKTYQAVSEEWGLPIVTMKRRLREAFQSLRRRLSGDARVG
jgi:DNA-directed RNA polymerase specialized sigma24 family protein